MEELIKRLKGKIPDAIGDIQYKGVEEYKDSDLVLKLTVNVKPLKQYKTEAIILREAKLLFDEKGVKIKLSIRQKGAKRNARKRGIK